MASPPPPFGSNPGAWSARSLDAEALKNGTVSLIHARGILPDGMVFHMPESDPLPEPRNIADLFPAVRDTVTIMLAVAPRRPEGANTLTPGDTAHCPAAPKKTEPCVSEPKSKCSTMRPRAATKNPSTSAAKTSSSCSTPNPQAT